MKPMRIVVITMATLMSGSAYAGDTPVLATAAYVQDAYRQAMMQMSTKQDIIPAATRPSSGRYNVVWNGDMGQFVFEKEKSGLQCSSGTYDIGFDQCIDPQIAGIENGGNYDAAAMTWYVDFEYGRVSGIASCTPDNSGSYAAVYPDRDYDQSVTGHYCYCKMTHPVPSAWVFGSDLSSQSDCSAFCAHACRYGVRESSAFRGGVFGSVGN